jgi:DNA-binding NarL/FixJ family response regulator
LSFAVLTDREIKVLKLLADGQDTAEVGRRLFYSERTVKNIVHDVTSRLNLRNRTQAVAYALRQGLI